VVVRWTDWPARGRPLPPALAALPASNAALATDSSAAAEIDRISFGVEGNDMKVSQES
jgi:hypothetical protein